MGNFFSFSFSFSFSIVGVSSLLVVCQRRDARAREEKGRDRILSQQLVCQPITIDKEPRDEPHGYPEVSGETNVEGGGLQPHHPHHEHEQPDRRAGSVFSFHEISPLIKNNII